MTDTAMLPALCSGLSNWEGRKFLQFRNVACFFIELSERYQEARFCCMSQ